MSKETHNCGETLYNSLIDSVDDPLTDLLIRYTNHQLYSGFNNT